MRKNWLGAAKQLEVSHYSLGTATFGEQNTQSESFAQCDMALAAGINLFDTAESYPIFMSERTAGRSEQILGAWIKERKVRDQVVIATKIAGPSGMAYLRGSDAVQTTLDAKQVEYAVNQSLRNLDVDYIDLYQIHWPARANNRFGQYYYRHQPQADGTNLAETLAALAKLQKQGKILHVGLSNDTPWGLHEALQVSAKLSEQSIGIGNVAPVSVQNVYNLLNRSYEIAMAEMSLRTGALLLAYSPLAFGMLTGKYLGATKPPGARLTLWPAYSRYVGERARNACVRFAKLAEEFSISLTQLALAFCASQPFIGSMIIAATNTEQLAHNLQVADLQLPAELFEQVDKISAEFTEPAP